MKIAEVLPDDFVDYMGRCEDQTVIRMFSGKTFLRIAGIESYVRRQKLISHLLGISRSDHGAH